MGWAVTQTYLQAPFQASGLPPDAHFAALHGRR